MKKLSIEQKAKAYDEAINVAKSKIKNDKDHVLYENDITEIFPELTESDDERIRKELISFVRGMLVCHDKPNTERDEKYESWIAWLENQYEQKLAWSEEDEYCIHQLIVFCENCMQPDSGAIRCANWLKFLKDRVQPQPKQEWSQNDIDMIDWLIRCCEKEHEELCNDKYGHQDIVSDLKRDCRKKWDWLESLKNRVAPQKQWKPSEEQLETLDYYIDADISNKDKEVLLGLYNDLKQL